MNCEDFHALLDDAATDPERTERLSAHASRCPACRERLRVESLLRLRLRTQPIPAPRPGYPDRVLARAHQLAGGAAPTHTGLSRHPMARWAFGAAAGCLLALGLWSQWRPSGPAVTAPANPAATADRVARVALGEPQRVQPVRLVFRSPAALSGVTIVLALPEGVELSGFPGRRELSWRTDLQRGTNLLELPVRVSGPGGVLTARLNLGEDSRAFSVRVQGQTGAARPGDRADAPMGGTNRA